MKSYLGLILVFISTFNCSFLSNQTSIKHIESPKIINDKNSSRTNLIAQLSKIGRKVPKSLGNDLSDFDFEKLINPPKADKVNKQKYPIFKSSQIDQKVRGLDQLRTLYDSLRNGELIDRNRDINTIRFIPSTKMSINQKNFFVFNLSLLTETEKVLKSEIYLHRRLLRNKPVVNLHYYLTKNSSLGDMIRSIVNSTASSVIDLSKFRFPRKSSSWQSFNFVDSLNSFLTTRYNRFKFSKRGNNPNFYYTLDHETNINELEDLLLVIGSNNFKKIDQNYDPYLIVYTNEEEVKMKNFFKNRLPNELLDEKIKEFNDHDIDSFNEDDGSAEVFHSKDSSIKLIETRPVMEKLVQKNRSNLFNYLPDMKENFNSNNVELIFKDMNSKKLKRNLESDEILDDETNLLAPWDDKSWNYDSQEAKKDKVKCQTKPLTVDFDDLSFSNWIIEPKSFESSFCDGSCKYPYSKDVSYSNYAALQSILNIIDLSVKNRPPELCCAPSSTSMLPIFYKDSNSIDYVVKYLPDMIVKECACR